MAAELRVNLISNRKRLHSLGNHDFFGIVSLSLILKHYLLLFYHSAIQILLSVLQILESLIIWWSHQQYWFIYSLLSRPSMIFNDGWESQGMRLHWLMCKAQIMRCSDQLTAGLLSLIISLFRACAKFKRVHVAIPFLVLGATVTILISGVSSCCCDILFSIM